MYLYSFFDESVRLILPAIGTVRRYDNRLSRELLKIEYTPLEKTFADYGHSLIYYGHVEKLSGYVPPSADWNPAES